MPEEAKITPEVEAKKDIKSDTEPTISEVVGEKPQAPKEETVSEALKKDTSPESVPLSTFLELKNSNKDLTKLVKELKESIEAGATKKEVSSDIKAIASKHDIDEGFLQSFADTIKAEAEKEIDSKIETRLKPFEDKDKSQKIDIAFNEHYTKALERMPEFNGIVNKDVIKSLSLNPANANKTFTQLIEESYGHLVTGKRTLEPSSSKTGREDNSSVDFKRVEKDPEYFSEVMKDPTLKKEYNEKMHERLSNLL